MMSMGFYDPKMRVFPFLETSPSAVLDAVQAPVMLYLWLIIPALYCLVLVGVLLSVLCLLLPSLRKRMHGLWAKMNVKNMLSAIRFKEEWIFRHQWSTCLYVIMLGSPLVGILCTLYGHHPLSFSAYDSPFQALMAIYIWLLSIAPYFLFDIFSVHINAAATALFTFIGIYTIVFCLILAVFYIALVGLAMHPIIRWHLLSIALFTAAQPFLFRFVQDIILSEFLGFTPATAPEYEFGIAYVIAFFLPCLLYSVGGILLHRYSQKQVPSWALGLHLGLLYLAVMAADLH